MNQKLFVIFIVILIFNNCKKGIEGTKKAVLPPETFMVVDTIFRTGEARLTTRVEAHWYGNSVGGFIKGFEISTDNQVTWNFTTKTDSIFLLSIPPGKDSADLVIYVRAIDNFNQTDPTPASTLFPIKNSPPSVKFVFGVPLAGIATQNPTNVFPVLKYNIQGNDPDGLSDISGYNIFINDTNSTPFFVNNTTTAFTLVGKNLNADSTDCNLYLGSSQNITGTIGYLKLNSFNTIYIQAIDKALSKSGFIATPKVWVKKPVSKTLVINAYSSNKFYIQNVYTNRLKNIGITVFDTLQATEIVDNNYTQLAPDFETQTRIFALFDRIFWFADDANFSLSFGQRSTNTFFANGGRMFLVVPINASFDPLSNFLDWTPVKSLVNPPGGSVFRVNVNATINPVKAGWPAIKSTAIIASARPFEIPPSGGLYSFDSLYSGGIIESPSGQAPKPWNGVSISIAKRYLTNGNQTNFVFSSIPLENFNGNNNLDSLFRKIVIDELGF